MRQPEMMPPKPVTYAVKKALGLPIAALCRWPVGQNQWRYTVERIA